MAKVQHSEKVPTAMQARVNEIVHITDAFARQFLNDEYAQLLRYAAAALARKRPSPLARGTPDTWACGITHAIGMVNFLFDVSQEPYMKASDLYKGFGVSQASGQAKSKIVRDTLKMFQFDPNWCLPSKLGDNPWVWLAEVNGLVVDLRHAPRQIQELAYEQGMIPYIPDAPEVPATRARAAKKTRTQRRCSLCGATGALTKTPCCDQWICDDAHTYRLFSFARNSCFRNHERYTLCAYHYHEGHQGAWQTCEACRSAFDTEIYVDYGTNEYNFEVLENPPTYEPTICPGCGAVIVLSEGGYSYGPDGYLCGRCTEKKHGDIFGPGKRGKRRK
jgi:hypothetical protein